MLLTDKAKRHISASATLLVLVAVAAPILVPAEARAATPAFVAVGRLAVPLLAQPEMRSTAGQQEQEPELQAPPFADPAGGAVFSVLGGSVFSGASVFQTGAAFAYFFGAKAAFGFEVEGDVTFGPGGRVVQGMGSFVIQAGARTSKFVPYFAVGAGFLRATSELPSATQEILDDLGIDPQPRTEQAPFLQFGGGVRFYVKPTIAFRADVRFAQVALDIEGASLSDRLYPMRRVAGMLSWDF